MITLTSFLAAFYPDPDEKIHLVSFSPIKEKNESRNFVTTRNQLTNDAELQRTLRGVNRSHGIYFVVNSGGTHVAEITRFNAFFCEDDSRPISTQHDALDNCPIPPSIRIETKKSVHAYWLIDGEIGHLDWTDGQKRLIQHFGSDEKIKNANRLMRLPFFNHLKPTPDGAFETTKVNLHTFRPESKFTLAEFQSGFDPVPVEVEPQVIFPDGFDNSSWEGIFQELRFRISQHSTYHLTSDRSHGECKGICHDGKTNRGIAVNLRTGRVFCRKGCSFESVLSAFNLSRPVQKETKYKLVPRRQQTSNTYKWLKSHLDYKKQQEGNL